MRLGTVFATIVTILMLTIFYLAFAFDKIILIVTISVALMIAAWIEIRHMQYMISLHEFAQERALILLFIESRTIINGKIEESEYIAISEEEIDSDELKAKFGDKPMVKVSLDGVDEMQKRPFSEMILILKEKGGLNQFYKWSPVPVYMIDYKLVAQGRKSFIDLKFLEWHNLMPVFEVYNGINKNLEEI